MQYVEKLLEDLFAMRFDVVMPLSGSIVAVVLAAILFSIRYFAYRRNRRKFSGQKELELPYHKKKKIPEEKRRGE